MNDQENNYLFLTKHINSPNYDLLEGYEKCGGYDALRKALTQTPESLVEEVKNSKLRGRGGAGFPTGMKWGFMPKGDSVQKYLVCNSDEGEPGTFKDRLILNKMPHLLIEGMVIAGRAIGSTIGYIYLRGEFVKEFLIIKRAIKEAYDAGLLGQDILKSGTSFDLYLYRGAGAYICGEETALLNSLEGKSGRPRLKPPFPAQVGAFSKPTCVNNVETFANVPWIIANGAKAYQEIGTEKAGGTRLFSISGNVVHPGVYELPMTLTLRQIIEKAGGVTPGRKIKAVIPGGASAPMLLESEIDIQADFDSIAKAGSMAGSGAIIVLDDSVCIVEAAAILLKFYESESCGQCSQCREGSHWLARIFHRLEGGEGTDKDLVLIEDICASMAGQTICAFSDAVTGPALSSLKKFKEEFLNHIRLGHCPLKEGKGHTHLVNYHQQKGINHVL